MKNNNLTDIHKAYIAGFLDGDGSIISKIVRAEDRKFGFSIRISVIFIQKTEKYWFLLYLKNLIKYGNLRKRNDGICEYIILSSRPVEILLLELLPFLKIKKSLALHILKIIKHKRNIKDENQFIEACGLCDEATAMTYSKKRTITKDTVIEYLKRKNIK